MMDFKGSQFEREVILWGVRWYMAYPISFRDVEEIVGMQMTKTGLLAAGAGWHHLANLSLRVGDDNTVN
jgi:hypothetical protein